MSQLTGTERFRADRGFKVTTTTRLLRDNVAAVVVVDDYDDITLVDCHGHEKVQGSLR